MKLGAQFVEKAVLNLYLYIIAFNIFFLFHVFDLTEA